MQMRRPDLRNVHFNKICRGCVRIMLEENCYREAAVQSPLEEKPAAKSHCFSPTPESAPGV